MSVEKHQRSRSSDSKQWNSEKTDRSSFKSELLAVLMQATNLVGKLASMSEAAQKVLDATAERSDRIDALAALHKLVADLPEGCPEPTTMLVEMHSLAMPDLYGPGFVELLVTRELRAQHVLWTAVRIGYEDLENCHPSRQLREETLRVLDRLVVPLFSIDASASVGSWAEARALIRLLRAYTRLATLVDPSTDSAQSRLLRSARALDLWAEVESRLAELDQDPSQTSGLYLDMPCTERDQVYRDYMDAGVSVLETSRQARTLATRTARGLADCLQRLDSDSFLSDRLESDGCDDPVDIPVVTLAAKRAVDSRAGPVNSIPERMSSAERSAKEDAERVVKKALNQAQAWYPLVDPTVLRNGITHRVIHGRIPAPSSREYQAMADKFLILGNPLPVGLLPAAPNLEIAIACLHTEFPWATDAIDLVVGELMARRILGSFLMGWAPILLVGPPGTGKTRLACRLSELLGLTFLPLSVGGNGDGKLITGTTRGWGSAEASPILRTLCDAQSAQAVVLLDEIDKAAHRASNGEALNQAVLGMMEPQTSQRWVDPFLQVPCDLSKVLWLATANRLSGLDPALLSRMRVALVRAPERSHYPAILEAVICDVAKDWGLPRMAMPTIDARGIVAAVSSVRQLVMLVRRELARVALQPRQLH